MSEVFELIEFNTKQVIIKVKELDNLTIARNPYLSSKYDYITVTCGKTHVLTIIYKDGTTSSFHWGYGGYTLISENLERLRKEVVDFIEIDCKILFDC